MLVTRLKAAVENFITAAVKLCLGIGFTQVPPFVRVSVSFICAQRRLSEVERNATIYFMSAYLVSELHECQHCLTDRVYLNSIQALPALPKDGLHNQAAASTLDSKRDNNGIEARCRRILSRHCADLF